MLSKLSKQDQQWQAESDAHMLAQYQELLDDKPRLKRALKQAKLQEENLNKRAKAMARAAQVSQYK